MRSKSIITLLLCSFFSISSVAADFALTTNTFLDTGALPVLYTCDGKDISPHLAWSDAPPKTQSFAIIVSDPDAPNGIFYHWIVYNIPSNVKELPEGMEKLPAGSITVKNNFGKERYNGPCPPKGTAHTYEITLYALDTKLKLPKNAEVKNVLDAMNKHILKTAKLTMVYSRWNK